MPEQISETKIVEFFSVHYEVGDQLSMDAMDGFLPNGNDFLFKGAYEQAKKHSDDNTFLWYQKHKMCSWNSFSQW